MTSWEVLPICRDSVCNKKKPDQSRSEPLQVLGSASTGRIICGTDLAVCVSVPRDFLRPHGAFPPGFYSLRGGVIAWRLRRPNKGNTDGAVGIFGNAGRVWATALRQDPPKKGLVPHFPVRLGVQQIP